MGIERGEGVSTRRMDCQGVWSSGTTYITFEDVKVPVENLLGKQNRGFQVIMTNFNHERIGIIIQCIRFSRVCFEESVKYASKRKTFGQTWWRYCWFEGTSHHNVRVLHQGSGADLWWSQLLERRSGRQDRAAISRYSGIQDSWR